MDKLLSILMLALAHMPELLRDGEQMFNHVATGRGGPQKVANVAADLSKLAATAANVAAEVQAQQALNNGGQG